MPRLDGKPKKWPQAGRPRKPRAAPHGATWLETRRKVLERDAGICWLCGHPGANEVDHLAKAWDVETYYDLDLLRAAHGSSCPCPHGCGPCNQRKTGRFRDQPPARSGPAPAAEPWTDPGGVRHERGCTCTRDAGRGHSRCW